MTNITEEDKKLLETLGLGDIPEEEKQVALEEIDNKMTRRFIANLLVSLEPDKARELEAEVQNIPSQNTQEIIEKIIAKHPDATKVLQDSAKQIMDELQAKGSGAQSVGSESQGAGLRAQGLGGEDIAGDNDQKQEAQETMVVDFGDETTKAEDKSEAQGVGSEEWDAGRRTQDAGEGTTNQETPAPEVPATPSADLNQFTADKPETSPGPVAEDKLPVPQDEPASPFGDEIKIVKDDEPTPNVIAPSPGGQDVGSESQDAGLRSQGVGGEELGVRSEARDTEEGGTAQDTTTMQAPATTSSDMNPFTADRPEPSALESATAEPSGQPILPDSQAQSGDQATTPIAPAAVPEPPTETPTDTPLVSRTPTDSPDDQSQQTSQSPAIIPDEPADAPAATSVVTPNPSANTPADVTTSPATVPNNPDEQPPQTNQPQTGASDYYQP